MSNIFRHRSDALTHSHADWPVTRIFVAKDKDNRERKKKEKKDQSNETTKIQPFSRRCDLEICLILLFEYREFHSPSLSDACASAFSLIRFASYQLLAKIENLTENEKARQKRSTRTVENREEEKNDRSNRKILNK